MEQTASRVTTAESSRVSFTLSVVTVRSVRCVMVRFFLATAHMTRMMVIEMRTWLGTAGHRQGVRWGTKAEVDAIEILLGDDRIAAPAEADFVATPA